MLSLVQSMSSALLTWQAGLILCLLFVWCKSATNTSLGEEVYNTTFAEEFKSNEIICGDTICDIVCDTDLGCLNTTIDAAYASSLTVNCSTSSSLVFC